MSFFTRVVRLGVILSLGFPCVSSAWSEKDADSAAVVATQRVVKLLEPRAKRSVSSLVDEGGGRTLGGGERFLVIRPRETASAEAYDALLEALAKHPAVEAVVPDELSYPLSSHLGETPADASKGERADAAGEPGCRIFPRCGVSNPAWAKLQVGADLADTLIERGPAERREYARVAVVDTGFDTKGQGGGIQAQSFETHRGHDSSGDKDTDENGHGTTVAGMISGKTTGVTHQVHLKIFRATEKNGGSSASQGLLAAAIEKACETSDVVNVSWATMFDEAGVTRVENALWYRKAAERGCLVIRASGNGGWRPKAAEIAPVPLDAPFLSVAATDEFSDEAPFSSSGGIMAPGAGVFSTLSGQHKYGDETEKNACLVEKSRVGPIGGTSFAAPMVAGIAGQVITILRSRGALPKAPGEKLRLIKSILLASAAWSKEAKSRQPVVNALTAALIARSVPVGGKTDTDSLIAGARKSDLVRRECSFPLADCTKELDCSLKKTCINRLRFRSFACVPTPPGMKAAPELDSYLFASLKQLDERELLVQLIDRLPPGGPLAKESLQELGRQWAPLLDGNRVEIGNFDRALNLLHSARRSDIAKDFDLPKRLREMLRSFSLSQAFHFVFPLGTASLQVPKESQAGKLFDILRSMPPEEQTRLIREIPFAGDVISQFGFLYYLDANRDALDKGTRVVLEEKLRDLAGQWFDGKLNDVLFIRSWTPALEAMVSYLPSGPARIREMMKGEPTKANLHVFDFGLGSEKALGKEERLGIAEKLLDHPKLRSSELLPLLDASLRLLLKHGSPESVERSVRRSLLENPRASLPWESVSMFESLLTPGQKALAKNGFFPAFIEVNVKQGIARLSEKTTEYWHGDREITNIMRSLKNNSQMPEAARKALFASPVGKEMARFLEIAAANVVRPSVPVPYPLQEVRAPSLETIRTVLNEQRLFIDAGFQEPLRAALTAVKDDVLARPALYSPDLRRNIRRLYGLEEERPLP